MKRKSNAWFISLLLMFCVGEAAASTNTTHPSDTGTKLSPRDFAQRKERDFVAFDSRYAEKRAERIARARALGAQVIAREYAGKNTQVSHNILSEIIWLISCTADFKRLDQRLGDLQGMLDHPERETGTKEQNPEDGTWGKGYTEWFFKLVGSFDQMGDNPKYELRFLDRVNSPEKLKSYFISVSESRIASTGIDNERELNESLSCLLRMILRHKPKSYPYDPKLKDAMMDLILHDLRNPATGFWGERYVHHDGQTEFVDNLSITFHVVRYLDGKVPDMDKVVETTLAIKDFDFPSGWRLNGHYWDHLNMDVAELFRLGWPHASDAQKKAIAVELDKAVRWCVTESLQPDGSFKFVEGDNSIEEGTFYGAAFLARVGYFNKSRRYWTDQEFPEAESVRQRIISHINKHLSSGGSGGSYYRSALREIGVDVTK